MQNSEITIGRLAARTGVSVSAVRFYEEKGLIVASRTRSGQRRFRRSEIRRLSLILIIQQFGMTLAEIKDILAPLPKDRAPTIKDWERIGARLGAELERRMETLARLRNGLTSCIGCGCLSLEKCALYNPKDGISAFGTGPRYLTGNRPGDLELSR